jgi:hypothetical protein
VAATETNSYVAGSSLQQVGDKVYYPRVQQVDGAGSVTAAGKTATDTPLGYQQVSGPVASTALPSIPVGAVYALITPDAQGIRWRDDGVSPTAAVGMPAPVGQTLKYNGNLAAFRFIQQAATAVVNISYYS